MVYMQYDTVNSRGIKVNIHLNESIISEVDKVIDESICYDFDDSDCLFRVVCNAKTDPEVDNMCRNINQSISLLNDYHQLELALTYTTKYTTELYNPMESLFFKRDSNNQFWITKNNLVIEYEINHFFFATALIKYTNWKIS